MTAPLDRERLAKLLGMCGSSHDGEVASAARHADRLVKGAGLTWREVVIPEAGEPRNHPVFDDISFCLRNLHRLNEWEQCFVLSLRERRHRITPKQRNKLNDIIDQLRQRQRAEAA